MAEGGLGMQLAQAVHLLPALHLRIVFEVRGRHPHRSERRGEHHLQRDALHARHGGIGRPGQQMRKYLDHRIAREDQVAELAPPALGAKHVDGYPLHGSESGQQAAEQVELVLAGGSGQIRIIARHFLQAKHVEIGHVAADIDNALRVHAAVAAAAGLDIPGY
jgi:hypothetical protein